MLLDLSLLDFKINVFLCKCDQNVFEGLEILFSFFLIFM